MNMAGYLDSLRKAIGRPADVLAARDIFSALARDSKALEGALLQVVSKMAQDGRYYPVQASGNQFAFTPSDNSGPFDLALAVHRKPSPSLVTGYVHALVSPLNRPVVVERYRLPSRWKPELFDATVQLERLDDQIVGIREIFEVAPGNMVYRYQVPAETLVLKMTSKPVVPFEWSFDEASLRPWQMISSSPPDTNIAHACRGAGALGDLRFRQPLIDLLKHPVHNVRWEALKALALLDPEAGIVCLGELVRDTHPSVARAAERSLRAAQVEF